MKRRFNILLLLGLGLGMFFPRWVQGEIKWIKDYNAAIRDSEARGLPILLDFYASWCGPCKEMDKTTLRDEKLVTLINERFIALKINGDEEPKLVSLLGITGYPTYVLATPDKKILATFSGKKEVAEFQELLQRALANVSSPDWMQNDYKLAVRWIANKDYARAIAALSRIVEDGQGRTVQASAQKLLKDLDVQGRERLSKAKQLQEQGQSIDAIQILTDTMRDFPGLMLSKEASEMLARLAQNPEIQNQQRSRQAQELLKQARDFHRNKDYTLCLERCSKLMRTYGDLTEGQEASQLYDDLKNDPEWLQSACTSFSDRLGDMYLLLAESLLKRGQPQQAKHWLERVIRAFPATRQAESAQIRLEQLQGTPTRRIDFQSP